MRLLMGLAVMLASVPVAYAADLEAGKAKATAVCAACHGAGGVSVSDTIPNLAGQKPFDKVSYLFTLKQIAEVAKAN